MCPAGSLLLTYRPLLERCTSHRIAELYGLPDRKNATVAGVVVQFREKVSKKSGRGWARILLEDLTDSVEIVVPPKAHERCRNFLRTGAVLVVQGRVEAMGGTVIFLADEIRPVKPEPAEEKDPGSDRSASG